MQKNKNMVTLKHICENRFTEIDVNEEVKVLMNN